MNNRGKLLAECFKTRICRGTLIELIFRGYCKNHCTYCYLKNYGNKLYPGKIGNDEKTMLANIKPVLEWCTLNHCWDEQNKMGLTIFSGELFTDDFGFKVLEEIYEYCSTLDVNDRPRDLLIPDNGNFLKYPKYVKKMKYYIDAFNKLGISMQLSISVDGKYCDKGRWISGTESETEIDDFYKKVIKFCTTYKCGVHPMISADNITNWKENFDWWMDEAWKSELSKVEFPGDLHDRTILCSLEVRNDNWTDESIQQYIDLLDHMYTYYKNRYGELYMQQRLCGISMSHPTGYDIFKLTGKNNNKWTNPGRQTCGVADNIHIRMSDLSIVPCHRQSYEHLIAGQFIKNENNNITDLLGKNVENYIVQTHANQFMYPHCSACLFNDTCIKHCYGAAYEDTGNIFSPQLSVCRLFQAKYIYLFSKLDYSYEEAFIKYDGSIKNIFDLKRSLEAWGVISNDGTKKTV